MIRISNDKLINHITQCESLKIPFTLKNINQRTEVSSLLGKYMNKESEFPSSELNFIKQVKNQIVKNGLYKNIPNRFKTQSQRDKIKYFHYNKNLKPETIYGVRELDMNSAYWEMLNKCGQLSKELYKKGKEVSKMSRLAAAGSLAKRTEIIEFDGEKYLPSTFIYSTQTQHIWFHICNEVSKIMLKVAEACGDDFIFFWTDAMFVRDSSVKKVKEIFRAEGYQYTYEAMDYVKITNKEIIVKRKDSKNKVGDPVKGKVRKFPFHKNNKPK